MVDAATLLCEILPWDISATMQDCMPPILTLVYWLLIYPSQCSKGQLSSNRICICDPYHVAWCIVNTCLKKELILGKVYMASLLTEKYKLWAAWWQGARAICAFCEVSYVCIIRAWHRVRKLGWVGHHLVTYSPKKNQRSWGTYTVLKSGLLVLTHTSVWLHFVSHSKSQT